MTVGTSSFKIVPEHLRWFFGFSRASAMFADAVGKAAEIRRDASAFLGPNCGRNEFMIGKAAARYVEPAVSWAISGRGIVHVAEIVIPSGRDRVFDTKEAVGASIWHPHDECLVRIRGIETWAMMSPFKIGEKIGLLLGPLDP